jgi:hypothetical protein
MAVMEDPGLNLEDWYAEERQRGIDAGCTDVDPSCLGPDSEEPQVPAVMSNDMIAGNAMTTNEEMREAQYQKVLLYKCFYLGACGNMRESARCFLAVFHPGLSVDDWLAMMRQRRIDAGDSDVDPDPRFFAPDSEEPPLAPVMPN